MVISPSCEMFVDALGNSKGGNLRKAVFQDIIGSGINRVDSACISETFLKYRDSNKTAKAGKYFIHCPESGF